MRFDMPEQKKLTLEMVIPIRWGDMDAMGHVNNTIYFRYMETVRLEWLYKAGCARDADGNGPVIVNAFCNFIKQLEYPGDVLAKHYVAEPGRSSFETYITLERTDDPGVMRLRGREDGVGGLRAAEVGGAAGSGASADRLSLASAPQARSSLCTSSGVVLARCFFISRVR